MNDPQKYSVKFKHANGEVSVFFVMASSRDEAISRASEEMNSFIRKPKNSKYGNGTVSSAAVFLG